MCRGLSGAPIGAELSGQDRSDVPRFETKVLSQMELRGGDLPVARAGLLRCKLKWIEVGKMRGERELAAADTCRHVIYWWYVVLLGYALGLDVHLTSKTQNKNKNTVSGQMSDVSRCGCAELLRSQNPPHPAAQQLGACDWQKSRWNVCTSASSFPPITTMAGFNRGEHLDRRKLNPRTNANEQEPNNV